MHAETTSPVARSFRRALLVGGSIAGVMDISAAVILTLLRDGSPMRMLQGIAGALLGRASFDGGLATAALGLAMHFAIAFTWTALFYGLSRRVPLLVEHAVPGGIAYGALVYLAMYRGALPLVARISTLYLDGVDLTLPRLTLRMLLIHMGCVGLPIALAMKRLAPPPRIAAVVAPPVAATERSS